MNLRTIGNPSHDCESALSQVPRTSTLYFASDVMDNIGEPLKDDWLTQKDLNEDAEQSDQYNLDNVPEEAELDSDR